MNEGLKNEKTIRYYKVKDIQYEENKPSHVQIGYM